jgi:hypothetical protein
MMKNVVNTTKVLVGYVKNDTSGKPDANFTPKAAIKKILDFMAKEPIPLPPKRVFIQKN